ncbi:MAG: CPBP family intramembrane metalloprotease [Planctomycetes bacterium]|nr:CPBP family intramembrane metalloprotease [Planctomycetota bacterium]
MKKAGIFVGLTFLVNWSFALLFFALRGRLHSSVGIAFGATYMFVPMTVALLLQKGVYREPLQEPLGISFRLNRWFLIAWLLPPVIAFATFGVSLLLPGVEYSPQMQGMFERYASLLTAEQMQQFQERVPATPLAVVPLVLFLGLVAGVTANAVAGFGEELGWRGFLQKELAFLGFWRSSLLIGFVWGLWHAPLILQGHNYPQHPIAGVLMMTILCVLLAPIFSYIRVKARSVIAAAIIHGTFNAVSGLAIVLVRGGSDLTTGVTGLPGFLVLAVVVLLLWRHDPSPSYRDADHLYVQSQNVCDDNGLRLTGSSTAR